MVGSRGNKATRHPEYRWHLFRILPKLECLDGKDIEGRPVDGASVVEAY